MICDHHLITKPLRDTPSNCLKVIASQIYWDLQANYWILPNECIFILPYDDACAAVHMETHLKPLGISVEVAKPSDKDQEHRLVYAATKETLILYRS